MKKTIALLLSFLLVFSASIFKADAVEGYELSLSAESAALIDSDSGDILYSKNHDRRMGMASTTKIMTALVAVENYDINKTVRVSPDAVGIEGSSVYLYAGEQITMEELLYSLLLQSANDAAAAIAIAVSGDISSFAELMNSKARELGLMNTHFTNPHGLSDPEHYTTAYELAIITSCALKNEYIREIVSTYKKSIPIESDCNPRVLVNHNKMLKLYDGSIGVKTGFTKKDGRCLVSAAKRDGLELIAVTLKAPDDWNDHTKMLDFGFDNYESFLVADVGDFSYAMPIVGGNEEFVTLTNTKELRLTLPKRRNELSCRIETIHRFEFAPIMRGGDAGRVCYSYDGKTFVTSPLVFAENIEKARQK